jgi:hypothetical protein
MKTCNSFNKWYLWNINLVFINETVKVTWFVDNSVISCSFSNNQIFASWTKIHFDPFKWYFNDIRDYMGMQSIFGLFLQLNWKETTFVTSWKNIYVKTRFNIPLKPLIKDVINHVKIFIRNLPIKI